jgi:NADH dehydrogenase
MKHVIIVGASFAGLNLTKKRNNNSSYNVTLIDRFNFHQFQPLFCQVATAGLKSSTGGAVVPINKPSAPVLKPG